MEVAAGRNFWLAGGVSTSTRYNANLLPVMMLSPLSSKSDRSNRPGFTLLARRRSAGRNHGEARSAFTLLEIIIALAILSMLVGLAVVNLGSTLDNASNTTAKLFVSESIKVPITSYRIAMGDYPSTAEGLQALVTAPASKAEQWHGPYLSDPKIPLDPWGEPYVYKYPGVHNPKGYDIYSKGPDKVDGTADDIGNW